MREANSPKKVAPKCQMGDQLHLKKKKKTTYDNVELSVMNLSQALTSHLNNEKPANSDDEIFGQLITSELKKMSESTKTEVKKNILKIIYQI